MILLYCLSSIFSVTDNKIGVIPMGLIKVNSDEKDNIKNDKFKFSMYYMLSGWDIPRISSPFLSTTCIALINLILAFDNSLFLLIILWFA